MLSLHGQALPELSKKQGDPVETHIMPRPAKTSASRQTWPLTSSPGQGAPVPITSLPDGARLYWLPVLFPVSDIRNDTSPEGQRVKNELRADERSRYVYGPLVLDASRREVSVDDQEIELTPKEFRLLEYLLRHPGWTRTREMLLDAVWGCDYYGTPRTVDVHVRRIKQKIPFLTSAIVSVHSLGYKLRDRSFS